MTFARARLCLIPQQRVPAKLAMKYAIGKKIVLSSPSLRKDHDRS